MGLRQCVNTSLVSTQMILPVALGCFFTMQISDLCGIALGRCS